MPAITAVVAAAELAASAIVGRTPVAVRAVAVAVAIVGSVASMKLLKQ